MQNQANTTSSSSSATVDRHGISWIEDPTSTTLSSSQTSNPIVDNDFLSGSQHFFDIDELLRNLIGQKDLVSREEFKPGETIYLCVRCQLGYHEDSYLYINNRCDQCQTNDKITAYTLPHHLSFDDYYNQGISAFNQKNYEQAINKFTRALTLDPNHTDAYVWRSDAYIQLGQYQQTIEDCTQIISIDPDNIPAYVRRGFARLSLEEYQQSLEDSNRAISLISLTFNQTHTDSWLSQAYAQQGDAHQALGNSNEAIENYQKALDIVPNDDLRAKLDALNNAKNHLFEQYFNQGITLVNQENYQQAIEQFTRALTLNPNHADAYVWRGYVYHCLNKYQEVIDNCNQAIRLNPNHANAYGNRANAYNYLKNYEQAINDCNQAIRLNPNHADAYINRAFAQMELGEYQQAIDDCKEAIRLNPNHVNAHQHLTNAKNRLFEQHKVNAYIQLGQYQQDLGNTNEAIENYQKALDIVSTDYLRAKLDALQNQVTQSSQVSTNVLTFEEFFGLDQIVENQENTAQVNKILWEDIPKNIPLDVEIDNFSKKQDFNPFEMEFLPQKIPDILLESNELDIDASYDPFKIEVLTDQAHEDIEILFEEADHEISTIDLLQELQLAKEKLQARDYEAAIEKFNLVLNHNPDEFEAYYHRGIAYAEVGLYSNAIGDFNTTIALNKYNAEAYFQRGMIYKQTGDYKQAIRDFEFTLFFKPNHSLAYQNKRQLINL
ncbi:Translocon at the outer membrane of chloroplasts 64 [Planktothrix agardhii]|nr:Translocon at the outer membrane of chloroplasts 64 [Planktothrix agardhii]